MIFRRRQDDIEGFKRMREALRQQADPNDHALLDDEAEDSLDQYEDEFTVVEEDDETTDIEEVVDAVQDRPPLVVSAESAAALPAASAPVPARQPTSPVAMVPLGQAAQPQARAQTPATSMTTIGADTSWNGTLCSESNVYLEGKVEGTIEARDTIYIAERATIEARVKAYSVVVSGHVTGHVDCEGRLEVTPTGRLNGEAVAGSLVVHDGALLNGRVRMKTPATTTSES